MNHIEKETHHSGTLIVIEGIDGSGKSTLARQLYAYLEQHLSDVYLTKEPGDTTLGGALRAILQDKDIPLTPKAEYLLFAADRAQHIDTKIVPKLNQGAVIVCDRMTDSSVVYQGYARGVALDMIDHINRWTMNDITPDITLYLRVDAETARKRLLQRNDQLTRFEAQPLSFYQTLIDGFEDLYKDKASCVVIDAAQPPEQVLQDALSAIEKQVTQLRTHKNNRAHA